MEVIFQLKGPKQEESSHSIEAFNKLSSLRLDRLPGLTRVWEMGSSQPMLTGSSFGNLKSLEVGFCNQLKYLFSSSIVKLLVSIEDIEVHNCEKMEEIVAAEEETDETITLPKVKSIKLESLPKLKYFCGEAYTLKLPSLELLEVDDVAYTALGVAEWMGDLNATLRNIYDTSKDEDNEIDIEDEDDEIDNEDEDEDDEIDGKDDDDKIDGKDEDDETNREDEHR
nr:acidic leucine-rich nuclear phosphoprotein 32 family member B-like [Malus domestica]